MADRATSTAVRPRRAPQDRHAPEAVVPPAPSSFRPRRRGWAAIALHGHPAALTTTSAT
jgi:hypothetical protein